MSSCVKNIRNKILTVGFIVLLIFVGLGAFSQVAFGASGMDFSSYVKIGLKYGSSGVSTSAVESKSGFVFGSVSGNGFVEYYNYNDLKGIKVSVIGTALEFRDSSGMPLRESLGVDMSLVNCILPYDYGEKGIVTIDGVNYRGGVLFIPNNSGTLSIVNYLNVEEYLYGVINGEMGYGNPLEALKAQAVSARSYTSTNIGRHLNDGFDLCSGTHCQMYKGYRDEHVPTTKAVDETKGIVIKYKGKVVPSFYYKNSGGYTQNSEDVWNGVEEYLRAVKDIYSPEYPWTITYSFGELEQILSKSGYSIGKLQRVSIIKRNSSGAVSSLEFRGTGGTTVLEKEKIRTVLGYDKVKSNMFKLVGSTSESKGGYKSLFSISNGQTTQNSDSDVYVVSSTGSTVKIAEPTLFVSSIASQIKILTDKVIGSSTSSSSLGSTIVASQSTEYIESGNVVFSGLGYGHGIGMPQDSAIQMAKQGFKFEEILKFYYTGIEMGNFN